MRLAVAAIVVLVLACVGGCTKEHAGDESELYGTWVRGANYGDTLWFMKKNGQDIVRIPAFDPFMSAYFEKEYRLRNGVLSIKSFAPSSQLYYPINSFNWVDRGKEFTITNSELFLFMSSIVTLKYKKI